MTPAAPDQPLDARDERATLPPQGGIRVPSAVFSELRRSLSEVAGTEPANEVLFRLGRSWGASDGCAGAARPGHPEAPEQRIRSCFAALHERGLGRVELRELQHSAARKDCRLVVSVQSGPDAPADGAGCGLTLGYLTGFAGAVLDLDLVCTPFHCSGQCGSTGCPFEIRPAHTWSGRGPGLDEPRPPSGSTRFFLPTLGSAMSGSDISLNEIVEHSGDAIMFVDTGDVVRFWNRGAEILFGYSRDEVVGRRIGFLVPPELREERELGWIQDQVEAHGILSNYITRRIRKDGSEIAVSLTRTLLHDSSGRVVGSTAILRDVTEQVRAEQELRSTRDLALIGELAATVAHEIKNPLAGIYAGIQLLQRGLQPGDGRRKVFEDIGGEIRRLDQTVKELLIFTRPLEPRLVQTELCSFVREILATPGVEAVTAGHALSLAIPDDLVVKLDIGLMASVITNLVVNAAQALEGPGAIRIEAEERSGALSIAVSDTGPGIPPELVGSVFHPFFTTKSRGSGLGLAIAKKNVEAHGGTIRVAAGAGPGARFVIELPSVAARG